MEASFVGREKSQEAMAAEHNGNRQETMWQIDCNPVIFDIIDSIYLQMEVYGYVDIIVYFCGLT